MDKLQALFKDARDKLLDTDTLIDQYMHQEGRPVDEVLVEIENRKLVLELLPRIMDSLDERDRKILERYLIDGWTMDAIGIELGISHQAVSDRLKKLPSKIHKKLPKITCETCIYEILGKSIILADDITIEIGAPFRSSSPAPTGYPMDLLRAVNRGGYWRYSRPSKKKKPKRYSPKKLWVTRTVCKMPGYIGENVACTLCDGRKKCTYKKS